MSIILIYLFLYQSYLRNYGKATNFKINMGHLRNMIFFKETLDRKLDPRALVDLNKKIGAAHK